MKTVLNNLKPFIVYWISFAVYAIISSFEILNIEALIIVFFVVYIISDVLIGFTQDIKEILPGIILFELQLIICAIIFSINTGGCFISSRILISFGLRIRIYQTPCSIRRLLLIIDGIDQLVTC